VKDHNDNTTLEYRLSTIRFKNYLDFIWFFISSKVKVICQLRSRFTSSKVKVICQLRSRFTSSMVKVICQLRSRFHKSLKMVIFYKESRLWIWVKSVKSKKILCSLSKFRAKNDIDIDAIWSQGCEKKLEIFFETDKINLKLATNDGQVSDLVSKVITSKKVKLIVGKCSQNVKNKWIKNGGKRFDTMTTMKIKTWIINNTKWQTKWLTKWRTINR